MTAARGWSSESFAFDFAIQNLRNDVHPMRAGIVFSGHQLGSFFGAWLGGYVYALYARFASYDWVWILSIGLSVTAARLSWPVDERPIRRPAHAVAA